MTLSFHKCGNRCITYVSDAQTMISLIYICTNIRIAFSSLDFNTAIHSIAPQHCVNTKTSLATKIVCIQKMGLFFLSFVETVTQCKITYRTLVILSRFWFTCVNILGQSHCRFSRAFYRTCVNGLLITEYENVITFFARCTYNDYFIQEHMCIDMIDKAK